MRRGLWHRMLKGHWPLWRYTRISYWSPLQSRVCVRCQWEEEE